MSETEGDVKREYLVPDGFGPNGNLFYYFEEHLKNGKKDGLQMTYTSGNGQKFSLDDIALYKDGALIASVDRSKEEGRIDLGNRSKISEIALYPDGSVSGIVVRKNFGSEDEMKLKNVVMFFDKGMAKDTNDFTPENCRAIKVSGDYSLMEKGVLLSEGNVVAVVNRKGEKVEFSEDAIKRIDKDGNVMQEAKFDDLSSKAKDNISRIRSLEEYRLEFDDDTRDTVQQAIAFYKDASHGKYVFPSSEARNFIEAEYSKIDYSKIPPKIAERLQADSSSKTSVSELRGTETPTASTPVTKTTLDVNAVQNELKQKQ